MTKRKGGVPLDELLAAHAAGRPASATKKTPARASAAAKASKTKPKKAAGRRLPRRDDAQVVQDGPPRLVGYARISTDDQTTALQADALTRAAVDVVRYDDFRGFHRHASGFSPSREHEWITVLSGGEFDFIEADLAQNAERYEREARASGFEVDDDEADS